MKTAVVSCGQAKKRRRWRKLHIGVDGDGYIVAGILTDGEADDATTAKAMISGIDEIQCFTADCAYDRLSIYEALDEAGTEDVKVVIPPRADAVPSEQDPQTWDQRNAALNLIDAIGRLGWQRASGYRKQGRVENTFFRFKNIFGPRFRSCCAISCRTSGTRERGTAILGWQGACSVQHHTRLVFSLLVLEALKKIRSGVQAGRLNVY